MHTTLMYDVGRECFSRVNTNKCSKLTYVSQRNTYCTIFNINNINVQIFRTLFSFCSQIKCWFSGLEVRIANREDPDQTASSEAV